MRDEIRRIIGILAATEARAQIAEAKANLALGMIIHGHSTDSPEQKIDPEYLCSHTLERIEQDGNLAASIAFNSVFAFLDVCSNRNKEAVHKKKSKVKQQSKELENLIRDSLMAIFPHS